jgi:hypothetical protein
MLAQPNNDFRNEHDYWRTVIGALIFMAALFTVILSSMSCNTPKRLSKIHARKPVLVADSCAVWFPVKSDTVRTVEYIQGLSDTVLMRGETINCDSIVLAAIDDISKANAHHVPTTQTKVITQVDTVFMDVTVSVEDSAHIYIANKARDKAISNLSAVKKSRNKWRMATEWISGVLMLLIIVVCLMTYKLIKRV